MKALQLPPRQAIEKPQRRKNLTLGEYIEFYLSSRSVTPDHQKQLRARIAVFIQWYGSDPKIAELDCDVVNQWLSALLTVNLSPVTVYGYRQCLRAVWWFAYQEGDNNNPPMRLKRIRIPQQRIEAFTHEEIVKVLIAAGGLKGFFSKNAVRKSAFWSAAIHAAYSTGLRRGDLLRIKRSEIADDGQAVVVQSKTGHRVCVRFSIDAMQWIGKIRVDDDERALPWPYHENAVGRLFRGLLKAAGVNRGSFRWLRRSAGSYAEAAQPGGGSKLLGHRSLAVFNGHYNDESISVSKPVAPPPIVRQPMGRPRLQQPAPKRLPPTVRIGRNKGCLLQLRYIDPVTKRTVNISAGTRDEAKALEKKAELEAKLLRDMNAATA